MVERQMGERFGDLNTPRHDRDFARIEVLTDDAPHALADRGRQLRGLDQAAIAGGQNACQWAD